MKLDTTWPKRSIPSTHIAEYRFKAAPMATDLLMNLVEADPILPTEDLIVADAGGQLGWNAMMVDRLLEFDYDLEYVASSGNGLRPDRVAGHY